MERARREMPVFWSPIYRMYVIARYADMRTIFVNTRSFSPRETQQPIRPLCPAAQSKLAEYDFKPLPTLTVMEEPRHMKIRKKVKDPYTEESVAVWETRVREIVDGYIDGFIRRGNADLVKELFWEAPADVAMEYGGIPDTDTATARKFAKGFAMFSNGHPSDEEQVEAADTMARYVDYSRSLVERFLDDPSGPGTICHAIRTYQRDPEDMDTEVLSALAFQALVAAHETAANSLSGGITNLLQDQQMWDEVCSDPSLIANGVDEVLRLGPSIATWRRLCVKDSVVGGVQIRAGEKVMMILASGNCDEAVFPDPYKVDFRRQNARRHLTFGLGAHKCLGAPLARLQIRINLERLSARLPHMRLVDGQSFEKFPSAVVGGPMSVLVEWDPAQNPQPDDAVLRG